MTDINDQDSAVLRAPLIAAMVAHVPFDGWTAQALAAGAHDLGLQPGRERLVFPEATSATLITAWLDHITGEMTSALEGQLGDLRVSEKIARSLRTRLDLMLPHREAVRRALTILARPDNAALAIRSAWSTADAIWRLTGDRSTDWNHYSKRTILAGVYTATLLVWLDDTSEGFADTHAFLDRRIAGVLRFENGKRQLVEGCARLPSLSRFLGRLRYPAA